jgi:hypothetical protein
MLSTPGKGDQVLWVLVFFIDHQTAREQYFSFLLRRYSCVISFSREEKKKLYVGGRLFFIVRFPPLANGRSELTTIWARTKFLFFFCFCFSCGSQMMQKDQQDFQTGSRNCNSSHLCFLSNLYFSFFLFRTLTECRLLLLT